MKKKLIDLCIYIPNNSNDSYSLSLEEKFDLIKVVIPIFSPRLVIRESDVEELSSFYVKILRRFKRYLNEEMSLHLSILDDLTSSIALAMLEEGWEVYAKSLKPDDLTFHTVEAKRDLLINTYKAHLPFSQRFQACE